MYFFSKKFILGNKTHKKKKAKREGITGKIFWLRA